MDPGTATDERTRIERAVIELVAAHGFGEVSVGQIIRTAEVSRETFYACFTSKHEAYAAAYSRVAEQIVRLAHRESEVHPDEPFERLRVALRAFLEALAADPAGTRCYLLERASRAGEPSPQQREIDTVGERALIAMFPGTTPMLCKSWAAVVHGHAVDYVLTERAAQMPELLEPLVEVATRIFTPSRLPAD